jgi:hypothetical protein
MPSRFGGGYSDAQPTAPSLSMDQVLASLLGNAANATQAPFPPAGGGEDALTSLMNLLRSQLGSQTSSRTRGPRKTGGGMPSGTNVVPVPVQPGLDTAAAANVAAAGPPGSPPGGPAPVAPPSPGLDTAAAANVGAAGGEGVAGTPGGPASPLLDPAEAARQYLFTPPPANFTPSAPPVQPSAGTPGANTPPPPTPMLRPNPPAGPPAGPSVGTPPTPPPAAPPQPQPWLPPGATFGPQFAQGMDPRILLALMGQGRGIGQGR